MSDIIKTLSENGVNVEIFEKLNGEKIFNLYFTEHDKVFEDEVADLKQRIRELIKEKDEYKRKCNAFGFENQDLKKITKGYEDKIAKREEAIGYYKDSFYRAEKNCDKLCHENKELEQRIAELESKEDEKPTKYITVIVAKEINGKEYVRLEDFMSVVNDLQAQIGT